MSDFSASQARTARRPHTCEECVSRIPPGTPYVRVSGRFEGEMYGYALCLACDALWRTCHREGLIRPGDEVGAGELAAWLQDSPLFTLGDDGEISGIAPAYAHAFRFNPGRGVPAEVTPP